MILRWLQAIAALSGWKAWLLAALAGALGAAAFAPLHLLPVLFLAFPLLIALLESRHTGWSAFWTGWWFGLGHFIAGCYWICISLLVEPEKFAWLIPFALLGINGALACYTGIVSALWWKLRSRGVVGAVAFAALWTLGELLRSYLFTGFPWNLTGYAMLASPQISQLASVMGVYGLSYLIVLAACLPLACWQEKKRMPLLAIAALSIGAFAWGGMRLAAPEPAGKTLQLRMVQPGIPQQQKWQQEHLQEWMQRLLDLSRGEGLASRDLVIWPESALPYTLVEDRQPLLDLLATAAPKGGYLLTGAVRMEGQAFFNSIAAIDSEAKLQGVYDKIHLVPFGEYVPLRGILPVEKITHGLGDFSLGKKPGVMTLQGAAPFGALICYEGIFSTEVLALAEQKPQWLLNVTNDGWFGTSSGPYQHLDMVRMRAIELGIPIVRVANTGISAVMDGKGNILHKLSLNETGILDVPLKLSGFSNNLYSRYRLSCLLLIIYFSGLLVFVSKKCHNSHAVLS